MEEALIKRILPHSIEAEQSVIGSMLMGREAIMAASEILTSDDFYQHQYGVIFDAMVELFNEGKPVDLVTLQNRLREKDVPPEISSMEFQLLGQRNSGDFMPIRQVVINTLENIERASKTKGNVTGIPTGFTDLDYKTSGLQNSDFS